MMLRDKIKKFPFGPGVYIMRSKKGEVLYIGKASSLRKRVTNYFSSRQSPKTAVLMSKVEDIEYIESDNEAQALLLEAALIKEKKPKYNISLRDDKSYPYIQVTQELYPRVFVCRPKGKVNGILLGPYPSARPLKEALNIIRKVFPYCSCKGKFKNLCLFYHLNLCPGPCANKISVLKYKENIRNICRVFKGERRRLIRELEKKMRLLSEKKKFEAAAQLRDKLTALESLYKGESGIHGLLLLRRILKLPSLPLIIEAIDISSLSVKEATGAVVVFKDGAADKENYRRYSIKEVEKIDDYAMIGEVVRRRYSRLLEEKKSLPDLVVIDGGRGHVQRAVQECSRLGITMSIIGIAKRNEEIWFPDRDKPLIISRDSAALHIIQSIRDEAHRFAHKYHSLLRGKKLIQK